MRFPQMFYQKARELGSVPALTFFDAHQSRWVTKDWTTYGDEVKTMASWLQSKDGGNLSPGDRVAIISPNRHEWLVADLAILSIGAVSVPIYPTSTVHDMAYILEHAGVRVLFTDTLPRARGLLDRPLNAVVTFEPLPHDSATENALDERVSSWTSVLHRHNGRLTHPVECKAEDLATIIYTSGTTGQPKGVMHTHGNFTWALKVDQEILVQSSQTDEDPGKSRQKMPPQDRFFSFLPLSHVAERILIEVGSILCSGEVYFARSIDTLSEDLLYCRPTVFMCVPRLWEKIHEQILAEVARKGVLAQKAFQLALKLGSSRIQGDRIGYQKRNHPFGKISDLLAGKRLRQRIGLDQCRILATGAAPFRPEIMRFFASFGMTIREVYGLTENFTFGTLNHADDTTIGTCGVPFPYNELRLASDGEVLFKAPWMFTGYYRDPEGTGEVLSAEGWFATGDLGVQDSQGKLRIVGRKKELIKTSGGKFVAPVPIENMFKDLPFIRDAVVIGDHHKFCVALVSLEENLPGDPAAIRDKLGSYLQSINASLASFESIKKIGVLTDPMSIANGFLTPTLKIRRSVLQQKKADFIQSIYDTAEPVIFEHQQ